MTIKAIKKYKNQTIIALVGLVTQLLMFGVRAKWFDNPEFGFAWGGADPIENLTLGINLAIKKSFFQFDQPAMVLEQLRTPLYPLFIAFGHKLFSGNLWPIILLQQVFALAALITVYQVFLLLFRDRTIAMVSSLAVIFDLQRLIETTAFSSEALFLFLFFLVIYFLMRFAENQRYKYAAAAGCLLGLATMTRVFAFYLSVASVAFILLLRIFKRFSFKRLIFSSLLFLITFQSVLLPWTIRNFRQFGVWKLSSSPEFVLFTRHIKRIYEYKTKFNNGQPVSPDETYDALLESFYQDNQIQDRETRARYYLYQFKYAPYLKAKSIKVIKDNLGLYLYIYARRIPAWFLDNNLAFEAIFIQDFFYPILDKTRVTSLQVLWFGRFVFLAFYLIILFSIFRSPRSFSRLFPRLLLIILFTGAIAFLAALVLTPKHKLPINFFVYALTVYSVRELMIKREKLPV